MCEETDRYWLVQMPLSWQHLKWKSTRLAQTFCKFNFSNLIMTLECETIHTCKRPLHLVPIFGTCNQRELSGFIRLVIQMANRKRQLHVHLGWLKRDAPLLGQGQCQKYCGPHLCITTPTHKQTRNSDYRRPKCTFSKKRMHKGAVYQLISQHVQTMCWISRLGQLVSITVPILLSPLLYYNLFSFPFLSFFILLLCI